MFITDEWTVEQNRLNQKLYRIRIDEGLDSPKIPKIKARIDYLELRIKQFWERH